MALTQDEQRHIVNTIVLALPKQDQEFNYFLQDRIAADGSAVMGLKKPNFGTVGAGSMPSLDRKGDLVGQKKIPLSRYGITKETSYSPKEFFVYMTQQDFFKLMSELNSDERSILNNYRGTKKLWRWDSDRFRSSQAPKEAFDVLTSKVLSFCSVKVKKNKSQDLPLESAFSDKNVNLSQKCQ